MTEHDDDTEPQVTVGEMIVAEQLAKYLHDTYVELAQQHDADVTNEFLVVWDALPEEANHKTLLIMTCLRFIKEKIGYTDSEDDSTDGGPVVFQGGAGDDA